MPANPIGPYQSVHMPSISCSVSQGHPFQGMIQMSVSPTQPFLRQDSLAVSIPDQVNQWQWASAANNPRQLRLSSHGRRCGLAVQPPLLPQQHNIHQIEDCMSTSINNGIEVQCTSVHTIFPHQNNLPYVDLLTK